MMVHAPFSQEELGGFCLSLAHLLHAGLTTGDALAALAEDETDPKRKAFLDTLVKSADDGLSLSEILSESKKFPNYICAMTAAGEEAGRLEEALFALADYYDAQARLDRQLRATLLHPLLLMGVLMVVIVVLLGWVLPVFDDVYRQLGSSLTGVAGVLLSVGQFIRFSAPVLLPAAAILFAVVFWFTGSQKGREKLVTMLEERGFLTDLETARLTRVLALCLSSGLDGERAMELACALGKDGSRFRKKCEDCLDRLQGMDPLPKALNGSALLSAADCRLLEAGYHSGCPDTVMARLAQRVEERSEAQLESWLSKIEPGMVLTASVLVGLILLSVLLPLTRVMASIG